MSTETLTDKEAAALFAGVSKAIHENDSVKLSELVEKESPDEETVVEDTPPEETQPEVVDDDTKKEETPEPSETAQTDDDKNKPTVQLTEVEKLQAQLDKVAKENHALRSQAGRVPHVQRRIKELDAKLEELTKLQASPSSQPSAKIQPKVSELLKGVRETDPELADAVQAAITAAMAQVAEEMNTKEKATVSLLREQEFSVYQDQEVNRLLEMYPNASEVFSSPSWSAWKKEQSAGIANLAMSDHADEVAVAFEKYTADMLAKYPELGEQVKGHTEPNAAADRARQVEAERKRKLAQTPNVGTPNAAAKQGMPDDPQALFEKYSEEIRKKMSGG